MHKCGFQPALPSQIGKKRLHGMCGQFLFRPAKRVDSASYSRGPGKAGQLALHVIEMHVKIIDNTYWKRVNSAKRVNSLSRDNSSM
jgi:hypothetical protein